LPDLYENVAAFFTFRRTLVGAIADSRRMESGMLQSDANDAARTKDRLVWIAEDYVKSLHERIRLLEAVIDNFPGGISVFDNKLRMVLCNEQQKYLLEYPDELFASGYPTLEQIYRFNAARGEYGPGPVEEHVRTRMALASEGKAHVLERAAQRHRAGNSRRPTRWRRFCHNLPRRH
jgi:PAS domain-containing protein